jgi:hypothetical protein
MLDVAAALAAPVIVLTAGVGATPAYSAASASAAGPAAPAQLVPATQRNVSFVVDGTTTYGTLASTSPARPGPAPMPAGTAVNDPILAPAAIAALQAFARPWASLATQ